MGLLDCLRREPRTIVEIVKEAELSTDERAQILRHLLNSEAERHNQEESGLAKCWDIADGIDIIEQVQHLDFIFDDMENIICHKEDWCVALRGEDITIERICKWLRPYLHELYFVKCCLYGDDDIEVYNR